jgi:hypothetical protein
MNTLTDKATALVSGLSKGLPAGTTASLLVNGQPVTVKNAIATLSGYLAAVAAVAPAAVAYHQAVQNVSAQTAQVKQLVAGLSNALRYLFGKGNPQLAQFGVSPGVPSKPSTATKAAAVGKALATRAVRHILGPKQRALITVASPNGPAISTSGK